MIYLEYIEKYRGFEVIADKDEFGENVYLIRNNDLTFSTYLPELRVFLSDNEEEYNEETIQSLRSIVDIIHDKYTKEKDGCYYYYGDFPDESYEDMETDEAIFNFISEVCGEDITAETLRVNYYTKHSSIYKNLKEGGLQPCIQIEVNGIHTIDIHGVIGEKEDFTLTYNYEDITMKIRADSEDIADRVAKIFGIYDFKAYLLENA